MALKPNYRNINKGLHYFCLMQPIDYSFAPFGIAFTSSANEPVWFECAVDESRYKVDDNYKITLRALNGCAYEHYYQDDFLQLMYEGLIIPKTSEDMHIEYIQFDEPIPGTSAYLHHEGCCVVGEDKPLKVGDKVRIKWFSFITEVTGIDEVHKRACVEWTDDEGAHHIEKLDLNELMKVV